MATLTNRHLPYRPSSCNGWTEPATGEADPERQSDSDTATLKVDGSNLYMCGKFLPANFKAQSLEITRDVIYYVCRHESATMAPSKTCTIMRNLVDDTLKNRLDMMCHLVTTLDIKSNDQLHLINNIVTDMFDDQLVNWGRIVTLCAFCGYLARYCMERCIPFCAEEVADILGKIVVDRLGLWIVANGGWSSFESQFPAVFVFEKSGVWKGFTVLAFLIGAVFIFYTAIRFING